MYKHVSGVLLVALCFVLFTNTYCQQISNLTDQLRCKLTHKGLSFVGPISKTESGIRCQYWETQSPLHKISEAVKDAGFPENSKGKAKNFCRNPTGLAGGPWCYTLEATVSDELCGIPLCRHTYCRMTGPGMEYAGEKKHSASGEECLRWTKKRKTKDEKKSFKFPNKMFPGGYRSTAKRSCRNPDGNRAGPWCYVEREAKGMDDEYVKELCDVPFCAEPDCMEYTPTSVDEYSHFSRLPQQGSNMTLTVKLWDPDDWPTAKVYLLLSVLATPEGATTGVEILLSNNLTGATSGIKDSEPNPSANTITGNHWTTFSVTWANGFIAVNKANVMRPLFLGEYTAEPSVEMVDGDEIITAPFQYYSIAGDSVLWSLPYCQKDCEEHFTSRMSFARFWHLKPTQTSLELTFHVRGRRDAVIELRVSPQAKYPHVWVVLQGAKNMTSVVWRHVQGDGVVLKEVRTQSMLAYWEWKQFTINVFGNRLQLFRSRDSGTQTVLEVDDDRLRPVSWFGVGSRDSVTHWTFFCAPADMKAVSQSLPPECVTFASDTDYSGTQWSSHTGRPCIPWVDTPSRYRDNLFVDKSRQAARNYCRNPTRDPQGSFCFVVSPDQEKTKEYCLIRRCRSADCRMAGTGNDYIGTLNVTRSGRTCQRWTTNKPHKVNRTYLNDELFPDVQVRDVRNYCRNPSRNIMGSWCYTTDARVKRDGCDVRDCDKPEECTVMTRGKGKEGRLVYILPAWRGDGLQFWLKNWDPDHPDGIVFTLRPLEMKKYYRLVIGAEESEKVQLFYGTEGGQSRLMKQKTLPRLIPTGKWGGLWLSMREGKVRLGFEGLDTVLFEWSTDKPEETFRPMFLNYVSIAGNTLGVNFLCHECHIERTTTPDYDKILPLGLWSPDHTGPNRDLTLYLRGTGCALVPLIQLPGHSDYFGLVIGKDNNSIFIVRQIGRETTTLTQVTTKTRLIEVDKWVKFYVSFNESHISVVRDGTPLLQWHSAAEPLIFYWFSVGAEGGTVIWSANCQPTDIDGSPRDGGWSSWGPYACSVTCGGGVGKQTRTCTNPVPNIYGRQCRGSAIAEGTCNTFRCGRISPDTTESLIYQLQTQHFNYEVREGERVVIDMADIAAFERIRRESPKATWDWSKNGGPVNVTRVEINNGTLLLASVIPADSGVYACILHRVTKQRMILKLVSLAVMPASPSLSTRITFTETLTCNNRVLGYIYSDLSQVWLLNGKVYKDYGITTLEAVNEEPIPKVKQSHAGIWKCVVSQNDLGFSWVTNIIYVEVKKTPTFLTYLMEDETTAPLFKHFRNEKLVGLFLAGVLVLAISVAVSMVFVYARYCRLPEPNLEPSAPIPLKEINPIVEEPERQPSSETSYTDSLSDDTAPLFENMVRSSRTDPIPGQTRPIVTAPPTSVPLQVTSTQGAPPQRAPLPIVPHSTTVNIQKDPLNPASPNEYTSQHYPSRKVLPPRPPALRIPTRNVSAGNDTQNLNSATRSTSHADAPTNSLLRSAIPDQPSVKQENPRPIIIARRRRQPQRSAEIDAQSSVQETSIQSVPLPPIPAQEHSKANTVTVTKPHGSTAGTHNISIPIPPARKHPKPFEQTNPSVVPSVPAPPRPAPPVPSIKYPAQETAFKQIPPPRPKPPANNSHDQETVQHKSPSRSKPTTLETSKKKSPPRPKPPTRKSPTKEISKNLPPPRPKPPTQKSPIEEMSKKIPPLRPQPPTQNSHDQETVKPKSPPRPKPPTLETSKQKSPPRPKPPKPNSPTKGSTKSKSPPRPKPPQQNSHAQEVVKPKLPPRPKLPKQETSPKETAQKSHARKKSPKSQSPPSKPSKRTTSKGK